MDDEDRPVDRGMAFEIIREFLSQVVAENEMTELDLPHIVVCRDQGTGLTTYAGPFPDGVSALTFAEDEQASDPGQTVFSCAVAALYRSDPVPVLEAGPPRTDP